MKHNLSYWLGEAEDDDLAMATGETPVQTDPAAAPTDAPADPAPDTAEPAPLGNADSQDDVTTDPVAPDMPEETPQVADFEVWKNGFVKESIKGDTNRLTELLSQVRDKEDLSPEQRKFVEDNWDIQLLRQNSNIERASRDIRRNIRSQLDKNNPSTSVVNHLTAVLDSMPLLKNIFIKLNGYRGLKGDLHRKYLGALTGSVQFGSGANKMDLLFNEREYSIPISTRFNAMWGDVMLSNWSLKEDDAERYLEDPELKRLEEGSPQEREALRHRVVIESIAALFEERAFVINVTGEDGTIYTLGWDIASSLRGAFAEGKLVVRSRLSENSEAMINDDGEIIPLVDISIDYAKETGEQDEDGKPAIEYEKFMERRDGMLFLVASLKLIKEASTALQGATFRETPYSGNPTDLKTLTRCVYSAHDLLMRQC